MQPTSGFRLWAVLATLWASVAAADVPLNVVVDPADSHHHSAPGAQVAALERWTALADADRPAGDLLAVVRWPNDAATPDRVAAIDPAAGLRLVDRPLPPAEAAAGDAIIAALRAGAAKRALPPGRLHAVCLVSIRNADLPRDGDAFCQEVARLLQPRLTAADDVAVVDPGQVHPGPTTAPAVAPAVTFLDLQLSWAGGGDGGVNAKALLTDAAGRPVAAPAVNVGAAGHYTAADAGRLADALGTAVVAALRAPPPPVPADGRRVQADRFLREAGLCWDHADDDAALRAAEAAVALTPLDPAARAAAARGRLAAAADRLFTVTDQGPAATDAPDLFPRSRPTSGDVDDSLRLALAGTDLLAPVTAGTANGVAAERLARGYLASLATAVYVGKSNLILSKLDTTPAQRTALDAVRGSFRRYRMACQPAAAAAVDSRDGFDRYSTFLYELLGDGRYCFSRDPGEWADDVARLVPPYVDLAKRFDDKSDPGPYSQSRHPMQLTGSASPDPGGHLLYSLTGEWLEGYANWGRVGLERHVLPMARQAFTSPELDRLAVGFKALRDDPDVAFVAASKGGLRWAGRDDAPPAPPVVEAPPQVVRREPDRLVGRPAAAPPVPPAQPRPAPVPFWKEVQHLAEAQPAGQGVQRLFCPVVVGPDAFVVAMVQDGPNAAVTAQLWKLDPVRNHPSAVVGTDADPAAYREFANVPGQDPADRVTAGWPGTRAAVCGDTYVFTCWGQRVVLFPLAGGRPRVVTPADVGYPGLSVQAAALMDGVLYLAVGLPGRDGLLVATELATGRVDTLAASRRREHLSPFDDAAPMVVSAMVADPARHRVVFHATAAHWDVGRGGLYAFTPAPPAGANAAPGTPATTGTFRQLVADVAPPRGDPPDLTSPPVVVSHSPTAASQWLVNGCGQRYVYDLASDQRSDVPSTVVRVGPNASVRVYPWAGGPAAAAAGWITREIDYHVQPHPHADWGRIDVRTGRRQMFPMLRTAAGGGPLPSGCWPVYVADAGDGRVLVGDEVGLWSVTPPDDTSLQLDGRPPAPPPPPPAPPVAGPPPAGGQLPWAAGRTLIDLARPAPGDRDLDFIAAPHARGGDVYAVALGHANDGGGPAVRAFARLIRFSAADGTRHDLGSVAVDPPVWPTHVPPAQRTAWGIGFDRGSALAERDLFVATDGGLLDLPLDGSPGRRLTTPPDVRPTGGVCCLGGQVYLVVTGTGGGGIARYDPAAGHVWTVIDAPRPGHPGASSRPSVARPALPPPPHIRPGQMSTLEADRHDQAAALQAYYLAVNQTEVPFLAADPARNRLLYVAVGTVPDPAADGLWAFDVATARCRRLVPMRLRSRRVNDRGPDTAPILIDADTAEDGTVLLTTSRGLIGFDPRTDTARPIYQDRAGRDVLATAAGPTSAPAGQAGGDTDLLNGRVALAPPFAVGDGWVWSALSPMTRASLDGRVYQAFPSLRPDNGDRPLLTLRLFDGNRRLLAADHVGCWVLDLTR